MKKRTTPTGATKSAKRATKPAARAAKRATKPAARAAKPAKPIRAEVPDRSSIVTEQFAARFMNTHERTLQRWRLNGLADPIPYVRLGPRRVGYVFGVLLDWVARQTFTSTAGESAAREAAERKAAAGTVTPLPRRTPRVVPEARA